MSKEKRARGIARPRSRERGPEPTKRPNRDSVRRFPLPPHLQTTSGPGGEAITHFVVRRLAQPLGPYLVKDGYGEKMPAGVYFHVRGVGAVGYNSYGIVSSTRHLVGIISPVPEQPTGWASINDTGRMHHTVREVVLDEAWHILRAVGDGNANQGPYGHERTRAPYHGHFPSPGVFVDCGGSVMGAYDQERRRIIEVAHRDDNKALDIEDREAACVKLTRNSEHNDFIELEIGPGEYAGAPGLRGDGNCGDVRGNMHFHVDSITALEKLRDALSSAIEQAKADGWPYSKAQSAS